MTNQKAARQGARDPVTKTGVPVDRPTPQDGGPCGPAHGSTTTNSVTSSPTRTVDHPPRLTPTSRGVLCVPSRQWCLLLDRVLQSSRVQYFGSGDLVPPRPPPTGHPRTTSPPTRTSSTATALPLPFAFIVKSARTHLLLPPLPGPDHPLRPDQDLHPTTDPSWVHFPSIPGRYCSRPRRVLFGSDLRPVN